MWADVINAFFFPGYAFKDDECAYFFLSILRPVKNKQVFHFTQWDDNDFEMFMNYIVIQKCFTLIHCQIKHVRILVVNTLLPRHCCKYSLDIVELWSIIKTWRSRVPGRRSSVDLSVWQCDKMARWFAQYLVTYTNENLLKRKINLPKQVPNFANY